MSQVTVTRRDQGKRSRDIMRITNPQYVSAPRREDSVHAVYASRSQTVTITQIAYPSFRLFVSACPRLCEIRDELRLINRWGVIR